MGTGHILTGHIFFCLQRRIKTRVQVYFRQLWTYRTIGQFDANLVPGSFASLNTYKLKMKITSMKEVTIKLARGLYRPSFIEKHKVK